jgi:O-6-methylguanine DNA methyltransferase
MIEIFSRNISDTWFAIACIKQEIVGTSFGETEQDALRKLLDNLPLNEPFQVLFTQSTLAKNAFTVLSEIFEGKNVNPKINLAFTHLPAYTQRVLLATMHIPSGYVASYGAVAKAVGGGPRAVGNVMANNCFAPLVPCHRVVKSDFTLGGYGGGLKVKIELLKKESHGFCEPKKISIEGGVLEVFPVEQVLSRLPQFVA